MSECSLSERIGEAVRQWASSQVDIIVLAAELPDSAEWVLSGSPTPAHHLAALADVEVCTAREWLRVGRRVRGLPVIQEAFVSGALSYSKVRALVSVATVENEAELVEVASGCPAGALRAELARWLRRTSSPVELDEHQRKRRSVRWRTEADGMVSFSICLQPHIAAVLIAFLTTHVMRSRPRRDASGGWPTVAQQQADAFADLLHEGGGQVRTEVVLHVRGDGATTDDGTPISDTVIAEIASEASIRALIHDAEGSPVNASGRHRHPTDRQKRVVKARDRVCVDCGRSDLLQYDHVPDFDVSKHTLVDELELRCAPCHQDRHRRTREQSGQTVLRSR